MKTKSPRRVRSALVAILAAGAFTATLLAGPGPQYWNKSPAPAPAAKPHPATTEKCPDCKTTTRWVIGDRGPAGKGVAGASIAGKTHECKGCAGVKVAEKGKVQDTMVHSQKCNPLLCCK
ncbi:MAG: hypothetical protein Q7S40_24715 [Opitutaceae bacterium]|nr:hypothetical protein [Opitutaceae bacterium]